MPPRDEGFSWSNDGRSFGRDFASDTEGADEVEMTRGADKEKRRFWTREDLAALAELYPNLPSKEVAAKLNRSLSATYGAAKKHGLKKSQAFLNSDAAYRIPKGQTIPGSESHQFKKGQIPFNKGLRRPGWSPGRMKETQFRKGQRTGQAARNWVPIGTIHPDSEGYLRIKVREAVHGKEVTGYGNVKVWPLYNRYLWELHKGPIPPKHLVVFKDRDRSRCVIENLELMSMADNARRNQMWQTLPRELAQVIQLNGALKRKLRRHGQE